MTKSVATDRYARAVLDGLSKPEMDVLLRDIKIFSELVEKTDVSKVISSPIIPKKTLKSVFTALFQRMNLTPRLQGLCYALIANQRLAQLPAILTAIHEKIRQNSGEITAHVTTATPLDAATRDKIAALLSTKTGKTVSLETTTKPELLGGLVVQIGSLQIDDSVQTKLNRLGRLLKTKAA